MDLFTTPVRVICEVHSGVSPDEAIRELIDRANKWKCPMVTTYNGTELTVNPGDIFEAVSSSFREKHRRFPASRR